MADDTPKHIQKATALFKGMMMQDLSGNLKNVTGDSRGNIYLTSLYTIANQQAEVDGKAYAGYLAEDGSWYIQRAVRDGTVITYEYTKGDDSYAFKDRVGKKYESFDTVF